MSLYKNWTDFVVEYVKANGQEKFWEEYGVIEKEVYIKFLTNHEKEVKGKLSELAESFGTSEIYFIGVLDGINDSLDKTIDLESLESDTEIELKINFEKLYFNMLDCKADYLYTLPQWNGILTEERKKEITKEYRASKVIVKEKKIGRNDPCPCGSGKKYKKCCGKN
jgi:preprotein translocase subunit SecA